MGVSGRPFDPTHIIDLVFLLGLASNGPRLGLKHADRGGESPAVAVARRNTCHRGRPPGVRVLEETESDGEETRTQSRSLGRGRADEALAVANPVVAKVVWRRLTYAKAISARARALLYKGAGPKRRLGETRRTS
jgi:hypothetical protein